MVEALVVQGLKRHTSLGSPGQERVVQWRWATEAGVIMSAHPVSTSLAAALAYSGSIEGCTFKPPYLAAVKIRGGTNNPNDTAIIKLIGPFGVSGG